ncbi:hypothetical protein CRENBAI_010613 [Crenichthys baileyi]|uniref:Uncharacterized protein n=1 Tax=Crenichthys baileyi TaxID=28760 RepID=A0AAV9QYA1_9TELE
MSSSATFNKPGGPGTCVPREMDGEDEQWDTGTQNEGEEEEENTEVYEEEEEDKDAEDKRDNEGYEAVWVKEKVKEKEKKDDYDNHCDEHDERLDDEVYKKGSLSRRRPASSFTEGGGLRAYGFEVRGLTGCRMHARTHVRRDLRIPGSPDSEKAYWRSAPGRWSKDPVGEFASGR